MKILFIGLTENSTIRGVERYCLELLRGIAQTPDVEITLLLGQWQVYYQPLSQIGIKFLYADCSKSKVSRHLYLATKMRQLSKTYDIIHYGNILPLFLPIACKLVMTIHDVAEFHVPEKYGFLQLLYRKLILKISSRIVNQIITVSNFSKNSIVRYLQQPPHKVSVIHNGCDHFLKPEVSETAKTLPSIPNKYFLYLGPIEKTKGLEDIIQAFNLFKTRYTTDYTLLLVGKEANALSSILPLLNAQIKYLGYLPDTQVVTLLKNAQAFLYVSHYEGFGFPVLEAFIHNDNIITASTTSLGEISAEFAYQVRPGDISAILAAMIQSIEAPKTFIPKRKKQILENFTWYHAAKATVQVYKKVLEHEG